MRTLLRPFLLLGLAGLLAACNFPGGPAGPTAAGPTGSPEALAAASATPSPAPTPVPPTATPTPTATPLPPMLRIAYLDGSDLWAFEPGTDPVQVTSAINVGDLRLSSDGELIVYLVIDSNFEFTELRAVGFDGTDDRQLLAREDLGTLYPLEGFVRYTLSDFRFIPGTHRLLLNTRGVLEGPGLAKSDDLLSLDADAGILLPLLGQGEGGDFTVSPDGSELALMRPDSLSFVRPDGTNLRSAVFSFPFVMTFSEYLYYPRPVWSPSGDSVFLAIPSENPFAESPSGMIRQVPLAGGSGTVLASISGDLFRPQAEAALISPDGTTVAFLRAAIVVGEQELVLYRHATGESISYATGSLQWKGWAPDSAHFAYTSGSGLDLLVGGIGEPPAPLGSAIGLRWIDDQQYLYLAGSLGAWTLTLGDLGATPIELLDLAGSASGFASYDFAR